MAQWAEILKMEYMGNYNFGFNQPKLDQRAFLIRQLLSSHEPLSPWAMSQWPDISKKELIGKLFLNWIDPLSERSCVVKPLIFVTYRGFWAHGQQRAKISLCNKRMAPICYKTLFQLISTSIVIPFHQQDPSGLRFKRLNSWKNRPILY